MEISFKLSSCFFDLKRRRKRKKQCDQFHKQHKQLKIFTDKIRLEKKKKKNDKKNAYIQKYPSTVFTIRPSYTKKK